MQRSLFAIAGLIVSGAWVVACTMKAPQDVSQASAKAAAVVSTVKLAASVPAPEPALEQTTPPAVVTTARVEKAPSPAVKPDALVSSKQKDVVVAADGREEKAEKKPSRLAFLASAANSLPLLSMLRGEDGRISPINMMMKIRSMMPMCAGGNCVTTSSGFQRVNGKEPVKPLTAVTAG